MSHVKSRRKIDLRGTDLLHDPLLNKGSAFTENERESLGLLGLLPPRVNSLENQVDRVMENIRSKHSAIEKYLYLAALQERNKTLFYRAVLDHLQELMPIIYTPTVGQACQEYGHVYRSNSPRLYAAIEHKGRIREILKNWPQKDVRIMVVTDGERILGLGDLGVDGMGIPVGKLTLYTACAGIHPQHCLPVVLDVGTNNETLLKNPLYLGMPHPRLRAQAYDDFLEEFVTAVSEFFPQCLIQFEDFATANAFRLLEKYRERACVFNDDIQGTAAVTLAGLYSALRIKGGKLRDERIVFMGAGEAGIGIGRLVLRAMVSEGLSEKEARSRCFFIDSKGLVVISRSDLSNEKRSVACDFPPLGSLLEAVQKLKPTALIGACGHRGVFTPEILRLMAALNPRPIIFAISNPTSLSECTAREAYEYTSGRGIFASGSPFDPVTFEGKTFYPGQCNNAYVFPGVGLGVIASQARRVTDEMFYTAAQTLASLTSEDDLKRGSLFTPLKNIREVSLNIAEAVANIAYRTGLARAEKPGDLRNFLKSQMYEPVYEDYH